MEAHKAKSEDKSSASAEYKLRVEGVHCSSCIRKLESLTSVDPAYRRIDFNMESEVLTVKGVGLLRQSVLRDVEALGFQAFDLGDSAEEQDSKAQKRLLKQLAVAFVCSGNMMLLSFCLYAGMMGELKTAFEWISALLYLPVLLYSGSHFYRNVWIKWQARLPSIDLPIALAIVLGGIASFYNLYVGDGHSYFDSLGMLVTLLLFSRYLLFQIQKHYIHGNHLQKYLSEGEFLVRRAGQSEEQVCRAGEIEVGDFVRVVPEQKVPVDGLLQGQSTFVNPAIVTGESTAKLIVAGELVCAGMQAMDSPFEIIAESKVEDSRLGQLFAEVQSEFKNKSRFVEFADRMAVKFTVGISLLAALPLLYFFSSDWNEGVRRALAVVVLACPCALAFATPLVQSLSLKLASQMGLLMRSSDLLEKLSQITNVFLDKTGTLTEGSGKGMSWHPTSLTDSEKQLIVSLEKGSFHPMAKKIVSELYIPGSGFLPLQGWREEPGHGVEADYLGDHYFIGKLKDADRPKYPQCHIGFYKNGILQKACSHQEAVKKGLDEFLLGLDKRQITWSILSGDQTSSCLAFAQGSGVSPEKIKAELLPEDKSRILSSCGPSIMVGDGANDLGAFSKAHVSVAVDGAVDIALKSSDIYIANRRLTSLLDLVDLGKETQRLVRRNLIFSLTYNLVGVSLALLGYITPLWAAALMPISSLTVTASSLWATPRLRELKAAARQGAVF